jgi:hypothetical protein
MNIRQDHIQPITDDADDGDFRCPFFDRTKQCQFEIGLVLLGFKVFELCALPLKRLAQCVFY